MVTVEFERLAVKPGFKILDIGCGSGRHICAAYQFPGVTVMGVDLGFSRSLKPKAGSIFTTAWATTAAGRGPVSSRRHPTAI